MSKAARLSLNQQPNSGCVLLSLWQGVQEEGSLMGLGCLAFLLPPGFVLGSEYGRRYTGSDEEGRFGGCGSTHIDLNCQALGLTQEVPQGRPVAGTHFSKTPWLLLHYDPQPISLYKATTGQYLVIPAAYVGQSLQGPQCSPL